MNGCMTVLTENYQRDVSATRAALHIFSSKQTGGRKTLINKLIKSEVKLNNQRGSQTPQALI